MSRTRAQVVCALDELAPGTARKVDLGGVPVAVVRVGDQVYAIGDTCSHGAVSLAEGEVIAEDLEIECWKHGSTFSLLNGEPSALPATAPVPVFEAWIDDGYVMVAAGNGAAN